MVTDALMGVIATVVAWLLGLFPTSNPPAWIGAIGSGLEVAFRYASSMGAWVPVRLTFTVAAAVLACMLIGFGIKALRSLLSYFLAGGGSSG